MAVKSLSDRIVTNRRRVSGWTSAAAKSPVSTCSFLGWATAARISSGGMPSDSHINASAHSAGKCLFKANSSSAFRTARTAGSRMAGRPKESRRSSSKCCNRVGVFFLSALGGTTCSASLTLMICKAPVTGLISKTRLLAQAIASSWLSTQAKMYTLPWSGCRITARYLWSMRTVLTLSSRTSWIFS